MFKLASRLRRAHQAAREARAPGSADQEFGSKHVLPHHPARRNECEPLIFRQIDVHCQQPECNRCGAPMRSPVKRIPVKSARLDTRITPDLLDQLRRAAEIQGRTVSDYVAATLQAAVRKDITEVEIIRLSREDSEKFAAALIDPPPANAAMKRAIAHHRRLVEAK